MMNDLKYRFYFVDKNDVITVLLMGVAEALFIGTIVGSL